jgi:hypothetical protein
MASFSTSFCQDLTVPAEAVPPTANLLAKASLPPIFSPHRPALFERSQLSSPSHPVCTYVNPRLGLREAAVARCTTVRRTAGRSLECVGLTPFHCLPIEMNVIVLGAQLSAFLALIVALCRGYTYADLALRAAVTDINTFVYVLSLLFPPNRTVVAVTSHHRSNPRLENLARVATTVHQVDTDCCTVYSSRTKNGVTPPPPRRSTMPGLHD